MKILVWNCKRALSPNLMTNSNPDILVVTETRVGGDKVKEITNKLIFYGAVHTDTIGYAGGLWLLWN